MTSPKRARPSPPPAASPPPPGPCVTGPSIFEAQATEPNQDRIAAQAVAYTKVKHNRSLRLSLVAVAAVVLATSGLSYAGPFPVGAVGGVVLLCASLLFTYREDRLVQLAVSIKEDFDTKVFHLPWNHFAVTNRPSPLDVARLAEKYTGSRKAGWYDDTRPVSRPLDILICQQSDAAWGPPVHRRWAGAVAAGSTVVAAAVAGIWIAVGLTWQQGLADFVAPSLALVAEAIQTVLRNLRSAREKEGRLSMIMEHYNVALRGKPLQESVCRDIQNASAASRSRNGHVPDWFDDWQQPANQRAMTRSTEGLVAEAVAAGLTTKS